MLFQPLALVRYEILQEDTACFRGCYRRVALSILSPAAIRRQLLPWHVIHKGLAVFRYRVAERALKHAVWCQVECQGTRFGTTVDLTTIGETGLSACFVLDALTPLVCIH